MKTEFSMTGIATQIVLSFVLASILTPLAQAVELTPGLDLDFTYTGEWAQIDGGLSDHDTYLDNVDIVFEGDLDQLFGWKNSTFALYVLGNQGGSPSKYAGDLQTVSNIDAPDTWKLYELWYQRNWRQDAHSLRVGLYDYNSEFDVLETGGLFINSSFGIGAEIASSGENGPSIFPTTSLAVRGRISNARGGYLQGVVMDGVPGDPGDPHGTQVILKQDDGLMLAAEVGYTADDPKYRKFAAGYWRYTRDSKHNDDGCGATDQKNWGVYALAEARLYSERNAPARGLSGFLRYGVADKKVNFLRDYAGAGLVYTGLFPERGSDELGLAVASAGVSAPCRDEAQATGEATDKRETTLELTYRAELTSWLAVQPSLQYVIDPGALRSTENARVFLLRFQITP